MAHSNFQSKGSTQKNVSNVDPRADLSSTRSANATLPSEISIQFKNKCAERGVDPQIAQTYHLLGVLNQRATEIAKIHPKFLLAPEAKKQIEEFERLRITLRQTIEDYEKKSEVSTETKLKLRQILGEGFVLASEEHKKQKAAEEISAQKAYDQLPAWRRIINPVVSGLRTFPEKAKQIIGFISEGYKGYAVGFLKGLEAGVNPFSLAINVAAGNIANLREHYELTTKYGCILGNTEEFSKSNNWTDLWKLHPISLYGNPITESLSSAYDEYQLWIVNKTAGTSLGHHDFKKLQSENETLKWGVRSFNLAQIAGFAAVNAGITAPNAAVSSIYAKNSLLVSSGLSSVTSLGQEFLSADGFSFVQLGDNILASTAGSLSFQTLLNIGGLAQIKTANHFKINSLRAKLLAEGSDAEKASRVIERYLKLSNHKRWQSFRNFSNQQDQIDGMGDFSQTFENMGTGDWKDWKTWVGNALILAGNTQDTFDVSLSRKLSQKSTKLEESPEEELEKILSLPTAAIDQTTLSRNVDVIIPARNDNQRFLLETKNGEKLNNHSGYNPGEIIFPRPVNFDNQQDDNTFALVGSELNPNYTLGATIDAAPYVPQSKDITGISSLEIFNISGANGRNGRSDFEDNSPWYLFHPSSSQSPSLSQSQNISGKEEQLIASYQTKLTGTPLEIREVLRLFQANKDNNDFALLIELYPFVTDAFFRTLEKGDLNLATAIFATFRMDFFILEDGGLTYRTFRNWVRTQADQTSIQRVIDLARVILDKDLLEQSLPSGYKIKKQKELIDHIFGDAEIQDKLEIIFLSDFREGICRIPLEILDPSLFSDEIFTKSIGTALKTFCREDQDIEKVLRLLDYLSNTADANLVDKIIGRKKTYEIIRTRLCSALQDKNNFLKILDFAAKTYAHCRKSGLHFRLRYLFLEDDIFVSSVTNIVKDNPQEFQQKIVNLIKNSFYNANSYKAEYLTVLFDRDLHQRLKSILKEILKFQHLLAREDSWDAFHLLNEFKMYKKDTKQWVYLIVSSHPAFRKITAENNLYSLKDILKHLSSNMPLWISAAQRFNEGGIKESEVATKRTENIYQKGVGGTVRKSRSGKVCHVSSVELLQAMYVVTRTTMLAMDPNPELKNKSILDLETLAREEAKHVDAFFDPLQNMIVVPEITAFSTKPSRIVALHKTILAEHELGHAEVERRREKGEIISSEEEELIAWQRAERKARQHGIKIDFSSGIPQFKEVEPEINIRLRNINLARTKIKAKLLLNNPLGIERKRLENELKKYEDYLLRLRANYRSLTPTIFQLFKGEGELSNKIMIPQVQLTKEEEIKSFIKNAAAYKNLHLVRSIASGGSSEEIQAGQKDLEITNVITAIEQELNQDYPDLLVIKDVIETCSLKASEICSPLIDKALFRKLNSLVINELKHGSKYPAALVISSRLSLLDIREPEFYEIACQRLNRLCHIPDNFFKRNEDRPQISYPLEAAALRQAKNDKDDLQAIAALFEHYKVNPRNKQTNYRLINYALWAYESQIRTSAACGDPGNNPFLENARTIERLFTLPKKEQSRIKWLAIKYVINKNIDPLKGEFLFVEDEALVKTKRKRIAHALITELASYQQENSSNQSTRITPLSAAQKAVLNETLSLIAENIELDQEKVLNFTSALIQAYLLGEKDYYYQAMKSNINFLGNYLPFPIYLEGFLNELLERAKTDDEIDLIENFRKARNENGITELLADSFNSIENFRNRQLPSEETSKEEVTVSKNNYRLQILCQEILYFALFNSHYNAVDFEEFYKEAVELAINENNHTALCLIRSIKQLARCEVVLQKEYRKRKLVKNYLTLEKLDLAKKIAVPPYFLNKQFQDVSRLSVSDLYTLKEIRKLIEQGFASENDLIYALRISTQLSLLGVSSQFADFFGVADIHSWVSNNEEVKRASSKVNQALDRVISAANLSISVKNQGQICIVNSKNLLREKCIEVTSAVFCKQKPRTEQEIANFETNLRIKNRGSLGFFDILESRCFVLNQKALRAASLHHHHHSERLIALLQQVIIKHENFHRLNRSKNPQIDLISDEISTWEYTVKEFAKLGIKVRFEGKLVFFEEAKASPTLTLFRTLAQEALRGRIINAQYLQQLREKYPRAEKALDILANSDPKQLRKLANRITIKTANKTEIDSWVKKAYGENTSSADDVMPQMIAGNILETRIHSLADEYIAGLDPEQLSSQARISLRSYVLGLEVNNCFADLSTFSSIGVNTLVTRNIYQELERHLKDFYLHSLSSVAELFLLSSAFMIEKFHIAVDQFSMAVTLSTSEISALKSLKNISSIESLGISLLSELFFNEILRSKSPDPRTLITLGANLFRKRNIPLPEKPEQLKAQMILAGSTSTEIIRATVEALINNTLNTVIIPQGTFDISILGVTKAGAEILIVETSKTDYKLNAASLETALNTNSGKVAAILLTNPTNPFGLIYSKTELEAIAQVALKYNVKIICDELTAGLEYEEGSYTSLASLEIDFAGSNISLHEHTITIQGTSKITASERAKLTFACCGNQDLAEQIRARILSKNEVNLLQLSAYSNFIKSALANLAQSRERLKSKYREFKEILRRINTSIGQEVFFLPLAPQAAHFTVLAISAELAEKYGIHNNEEFFLFLAAHGISTRNIQGMGIESGPDWVGVRINFADMHDAEYYERITLRLEQIAKALLTGEIFDLDIAYVHLAKVFFGTFNNVPTGKFVNINNPILEEAATKSLDFYTSVESGDYKAAITTLISFLDSNNQIERCFAAGVLKIILSGKDHELIDELKKLKDGSKSLRQKMLFIILQRSQII